MKYEDSKLITATRTRARKQNDVRPGPEDGPAVTRSSPRPRLCHKAIHYFPLLEGNIIFIIVSYDIWVQCRSELVVSAGEKIPRSVTGRAAASSERFWGLGHWSMFGEVFCVPRLTVSNDGFSSSNVRFVLHLIVRVLETIILGGGRGGGCEPATKERLRTTIKGKERRSLKCYYSM